MESNKNKAKALITVIDQFIGDINPAGDASLDRYRKENLLLTIDICEHMTEKLTDVARRGLSGRSSEDDIILTAKTSVNRTIEELRENGFGKTRLSDFVSDILGGDRTSMTAETFGENLAILVNEAHKLVAGGESVHQYMVEAIIRSFSDKLRDTTNVVAT